MTNSYKCLFKKYSEQPDDEIFGIFFYDKEKGENWRTQYVMLENMAKKEPWDYQFGSSAKTDYPILSNYLNYTFLRCLQQNKVVYSSDESFACFNTGLQTDEEKDIFIKFKRNNEPTGIKWIVCGYYDSYSGMLAEFDDFPDIATYIENSSELVFDFSYKFEINTDHIITTNRERLPEQLRDNPTLAANAVEGAIGRLSERIKRNYKLAIPQWHDNKIQLLLPLCLTGEKADLALVADKDTERKIYRIRTAFTMDIAYNNARLICRPDTHWLLP